MLRVKHRLDLVGEYSKFGGSLSFNNGTRNGNVHCLSSVAANPKSHLTGLNEPNKEVVVLTGAKGALRAHILDLYRRSDKVFKFHYLERGNDDHDAYETVSKALEQRKLCLLNISLNNKTSNAKIEII